MIDLLNGIRVQLKTGARVDDLCSIPVTDGHLDLENKYFSCSLNVHVHNWYSISPLSEPDLKDRVDALVLYMVDGDGNELDLHAEHVQTCIQDWLKWARGEADGSGPEIVMLVTKEGTDSSAGQDIYQKLLESFPYIEHVSLTPSDDTKEPCGQYNSIFEEETTGIPRIYEAISNHVWDGHVLKSHGEPLPSTVSRNSSDHAESQIQTVTETISSFCTGEDDFNFGGIIQGLSTLRDLCADLPRHERHDMAARIAQNFAGMDIMRNDEKSVSEDSSSAESDQGDDRE